MYLTTRSIKEFDIEELSSRQLYKLKGSLERMHAYIEACGFDIGKQEPQCAV